MTKKLENWQKKGRVSTLTAADVRTIRTIASRSGQTTAEMARFYRVSVETIRRCIRGETWGQLPDAKTEEQLEAEANASLQRMQQQIAAEKKKKEDGEKLVQEIVEAPSTEFSERLKSYGYVPRK